MGSFSNFESVFKRPSVYSLTMDEANYALSVLTKSTMLKSVNLNPKCSVMIRFIEQRL